MTTTLSKLHGWIHAPKLTQANYEARRAKERGIERKHNRTYGRVHWVASLLLEERDRAAERGDWERGRRFDLLADDWITYKVFQIKSEPGK